MACDVYTRYHPFPSIPNTTAQQFYCGMHARSKPLRRHGFNRPTCPKHNVPFL